MTRWIVATTLALVILFLAASLLLQPGYPSNRTTGETVDLARYSGRWFQIAEARTRNALLFEVFEGAVAAESGCERTTVDYQFEAGVIRLRNTCALAGRSIAIDGTARAIDASNTRFKVTFDKWYLRPFSFDYWIVYVDPQYRFAILSSPNSKGVTLLSRTERIDEQDLDQLLSIASSLGYDTAETVFAKS